MSEGNTYPLDIDELIQRSYTVKKGSPLNRAAADKDPRTKAQLQVPGAAYSYMTEQSEDKRSQTVVVLFGDWKSA